jgi:hypothetical protein
MKHILAALIVVSQSSLYVRAEVSIVEWRRQLGTSSLDESFGTAADGVGNVYVSGSTYGDLGGPFAGDGDAFLAKYDTAGNLQWTRQLGAAGLEVNYGVAMDPLDNAYVAGWVQGMQTSGGTGNDGYVGKYDSTGNLVWLRQLGTPVSDFAFDISVNNQGHVFVVGDTDGNFGEVNAGMSDAFVRKYDSSGSVLWTRQLGTPSLEFARGVFGDGLGNVYIGGTTLGTLGNTTFGSGDSFIAKYDAAGTLQWTKQLGTTAGDVCLDLTGDVAGNVYLAGYTEGNLSGPTAGGNDAFFAKYDSAGTLLWTKQFGSDQGDEAYGVSADPLGNIYVAGSSDGNLGGPIADGSDVFLAKFSVDGSLLWTRKFGTNALDEGFGGVSVIGTNELFVSGRTDGNLGDSQPLGRGDAFVLKILVIPEPATSTIAAIHLAVFMMIRFKLSQ